MTSYLLAIVVFALSLTIYEIFANLIKLQNFDLEIEGQVMENKRTGNVRFHIGDFFRIVSTLEHTFTHIGNTHIHAPNDQYG